MNLKAPFLSINQFFKCKSITFFLAGMPESKVFVQLNLIRINFHVHIFSLSLPLSFTHSFIITMNICIYANKTLYSSECALHNEMKREDDDEV